MKIEIGTLFRAVEGRTCMEVCGFTADGKILAFQTLVAIKHKSLLEYFDGEMLVEGNILKFPDGRYVELLHQRKTGSWDTRIFGDVQEFTREQIEEFIVAEKAVKDYHAVATKRETGHGMGAKPFPRHPCHMPSDDES